MKIGLVFLTLIVCVLSLSAAVGKELVPPFRRLPDGRIGVYRSGRITNPGSYVLMRNLATDPGTNGIVIAIQSDHVRFDLNGFTLTSTGSVPYSTTLIKAEGDHITIENGSLNGYVHEAVRCDGLHCSIRDLSFGDTVGSPGAFALNWCISVVGSHAAIERNTLSGCERAIRVYDSSSAIIDRNSLLNGFTKTIDIKNCQSCTISNNRIHSIIGDAVGMRLSNVVGSQVVNNNVQSFAGPGIIVGGDGNRVADNVVSGTHPAGGLSIAGNRNHIEGNVTIDNGAWGISISGDGNVFRRNMSRGHSVDFQETGAGNTSDGTNFMPDQM